MERRPPFPEHLPLGWELYQGLEVDCSWRNWGLIILSLRNRCGKMRVHLRKVRERSLIIPLPRFNSGLLQSDSVTFALDDASLWEEGCRGPVRCRIVCNILGLYPINHSNCTPSSNRDRFVSRHYQCLLGRGGEIVPIQEPLVQLKCCPWAWGWLVGHVPSDLEELNKGVVKRPEFPLVLTFNKRKMKTQAEWVLLCKGQLESSLNHRGIPLTQKGRGRRPWGRQGWGLKGKNPADCWVLCVFYLHL